jgi:hypothetical protein
VHVEVRTNLPWGGAGEVILTDGPRTLIGGHSVATVRVSSARTWCADDAHLYTLVVRILDGAECRSRPREAKEARRPTSRSEPPTAVADDLPPSCRERMVGHPKVRCNRAPLRSRREKATVLRFPVRSSACQKMIRSMGNTWCRRFTCQ